MNTYDEKKIGELVEELKVMVQTDADELAGRICREIIGDFSPYSDGDEMIDEHIDLITKAEELVARFNK